MELGGPEVGRGCGGRGIIHGFELLEKLGFHDWDFDFVLLDFLGDVVCGGFGLPIARDMAQKVIDTRKRKLKLKMRINNKRAQSSVDEKPRKKRRLAAVQRRRSQEIKDSIDASLGDGIDVD